MTVRLSSGVKLSRRWTGFALVQDFTNDRHHVDGIKAAFFTGSHAPRTPQPFLA
jgi:hypothetical protein